MTGESIPGLLWGIPIVLDPAVPPGEIRLRDSSGYLTERSISLRHYDRATLRAVMRSQEDVDRWAREPLR